MILNSTQGRLEALSKEEQKRILQEEQSTFAEIIGDITDHAISSQLYEGESSTGGPILNAANRLIQVSNRTYENFWRA